MRSSPTILPSGAKAVRPPTAIPTPPSTWAPAASNPCSIGGCTPRPAPRPSSRPPLRSTLLTSQPDRRRVAPANRPPSEPPMTIARRMVFPAIKGETFEATMPRLIARRQAGARPLFGSRRGPSMLAAREGGRGDILIEGSRIVAVAPSIPAEDAERIPAERMIALPGFVDSHRHTWQSLLRGAAVDWTLAQYFPGIREILGRLYTPDDMYVANRLGALEALDAGITTLYDWSHNNNTPDHADEAVRGLRDAGIRAVFGYGNANDEWIPPSTLPTNFSDIERVRRSHFSSDDQLVTMAFAARG